MALPKQVQAQLAEVEELEKELTAQSEKGNNPEEVAADTDIEISADQQTEEPAREEVTPTDVSEVTDDFKQKYSTLRGKYDAEVPRLHQQLKELSEQLNDVRKDVAAAEKAKIEKPKEDVSYITDADREEYGEDLIDLSRRVVKEVSRDYEDRLEKQNQVIADLHEQVNTTGSKVGEMGFAQRLRQLVPDFDQIDDNDSWHAWLNENDPMSRGPRRDQAQAAFNSGDADAVAHYVGLFRESVAPKEQGKQTRQSELEKQVTPNRSASTTATPSADKGSKVYSTREIDRGWTKLRALNTSGKYDEAVKLEAELTAAYMEGRVRA